MPDLLISDFLWFSPHTDEELEEYYLFRWTWLRKPWNQPPGSERDKFETRAYHLGARHPSAGIIACGRLHTENNSRGRIRYMAVHPEFQGHGLGRHMLTQLIEQARGQHLAEVILSARNSCAAFYLKYGFEKLGEGPVLFDTIRHTEMRLTITV